MLQCVSIRLPKLMDNTQIGLIIIDSVGAVFRNDTDYSLRANQMRQFADVLLKLSTKYGCAIICTNQVNRSHIETNI